MNDEPLLKEEKETLIFNVSNNTSTMLEKKDLAEPTIKEEEKSGPISVDISALMAQDKDKDLKEEVVKKMDPLDITQENPVVGDVITPIRENSQEVKEVKEEKKDIEFVENRQEKPIVKEVKDDIWTRNNIKKSSVIISLVLTLIIVYVFAQVIYNFYVGFKYRNVNETDISEVNK